MAWPERSKLLAFFVVELDRGLPRQVRRVVKTQRAGRELGAVLVHRHPVRSDAETRVDMAVRVLENEILGFDGADVKDILLNATGPSCGSDALGVPCAQLKSEHPVAKNS